MRPNDEPTGENHVKWGGRVWRQLSARKNSLNLLSFNDGRGKIHWLKEEAKQVGDVRKSISRGLARGTLGKEKSGKFRGRARESL